ncbi:S-adenosyl-L-methionine-dependent methyltransferase [Metschnikowia bicuspidata var. bicuspidata NRRL YB-4993]|uniref:rRNA adenine N(6)-methyltransferase n=1 Tax=Metschnikowia bicuspidata var. bicuspidata NRRL YB-4993 TaxID=869754 RepID=A0A1A0GZ69_9ASCO|nr:S-adenosyl-L-methionine-dependent methyltransferase [Metschnikowia bicuspidata var. bicuspidata NRRL YB-4993]OBA17023.1 S-adenosyl-L-methionine-dependent methyltransferase [Metschnikowia bicuspidata var. bicuspidata NRRL YB-4993]
MKLRSLNPLLLANLTAVPYPSHQYGFKNLSRPEACQQILDKLNLAQKYPNSKGKLDVIDVFSGYGLFSTMLNYELKPRNHIIVDNTKDNQDVWEKRITHLEAETGNVENFRYFNMDGHAWETFSTLLDQMKVITPSFQPRSQIHDELLIVGNMTSNKVGESLFAQWLQCCAYENWLQKYGRVRMLLLVREATTMKFMSGPSFMKRNRSALKRDVYTDTKLVAISDAQVDSTGVAGDAFDPNVLVKDQPVILPTNAIAPSGGDLSFVEVLPRRDLQNLDVNALDYLTQILMYRSLNTVAEGLSAIAPGAAEDLAPKLPQEILSKSVRQLTREDVIKIHDVYNNWAFKPSFEETFNFFAEDTRSF